MRKLFSSKKREVPEHRNLNPVVSAEKAKNTAEHDGNRATSDTRLGVTVLHEPSDPTTTIVEYKLPWLCTESC